MTCYQLRNAMAAMLDLPVVVNVDGATREIVSLEVVDLTPEENERHHVIAFRLGTSRENLVNLIAAGLNARGELYQPGGPMGIAERLLAEHDASKICAGR